MAGGRTINGVYLPDHMRKDVQSRRRCRFHGFLKQFGRRRSDRCTKLVSVQLRGEGGQKRECGEPLEVVPRI